MAGIDYFPGITIVTSCGLGSLFPASSSAQALILNSPEAGGFSVTGKEDGYDWAVPEWVYAMHGQKAPAQRAVVPNGLGRYVIFLPNSYVIHSPPPPESPLQGPKPGSFMVPEADLAAIWPRITTQTRVYIF